MIHVTEPDGNEIVLGPFEAGMTGGVATSFTPTKVGEYTIKSVYPGQVSTLTNSQNDDPSTADYHPELLGSKFLPSESPSVTLTVQQDPVGFQYQTPPLPDYYWTRPIFASNWDWGKEIGSNWYGLDSTGFTTTGKYDVIGGFQEYGRAPNSPHILWTKPVRFGGQPGGPIPSDQSTQFSSTDITLDQYDGSIIVAGVLYYTKYAGWGAGNNYIESWEAVNLRTGELLWSRPAGLSGREFLRYGQVYRWHNVQGYGAQAFLWSIDSESSSIFGPSGDMVFRIYDAFTGKHLANVTTSAGEADTSTYARNLACLTDIEGENPGGILSYYTQGDELMMWNSTKIIEYSSGTSGGGRSQLNFQNYTFADGVQWTRSRTFDLNGQPVTLGLSRVTREVLLLSTRQTFSFQGTQFGWEVIAGIDAHTGALLWGPINNTLPFLIDMNLVCARDGYWFEYDSDRHEAYAYNLNTGQKVWGPIAVPFDVYSSQNVWGDIAYGKVFFNGGGAIVNCMDLATGNLEWTFSRGTSGYDTPFGIYPIFGYRTQTICDGKLFVSEGYLYTPPLHPARRLAIDCETGELVWSILSYSSRASGAHADDCFVDFNSFDNQIYVYGKGPSETTVTASDVAIPLGSSALVKGSVMDTSPGTEQAIVTSRFPNGLPVVSDESQRVWMEYVYEQQIMPTDVSGVTVKIEAVDPNMNYQDYGTTTTDVFGNYALAFEPAVPGTYMIIATFEGSESYCTSSATTYLVVDEAPSPATPMEPEPTEPTTEAPFITTEIAIIAAIAIAVVIGVASFWALKKRK
jgi:hypothetical protein